MLDELRTLLAIELKAQPGPGEALLTALGGADVSERELEIFSLLQQTDDYWTDPGKNAESRRDRLVPALQRALRDEASVRIHERDLESGYLVCLPDSPDQSPALTYASLHVQLHDDEHVEMAGALADIRGTGTHAADVTRARYHGLCHAGTDARNPGALAQHSDVAGCSSEHDGKASSRSAFQDHPGRRPLP
ncbi:Uncharacterized protein ALO73_05101 [Pseudomonas syringae pv. daphniphylli]|uniref:Uncharacterized protein n=1 Tax=Pseudomonas syringae pv. daphniphylli TaxID=264455 RepID=A0A9X0H481_PSESX|nr:Uncharacterized protein ALO73_05101 [Pseudomonas syringae pv. daphniphylli]